MTFGLAALALAFVACRARATDGLRPPRDEEIRRLVAGLGSPAKHDREAAEAALGLRGPVILAELARLLPACTGEARLRLDRVVARLEVDLVERSMEPSRVSLSVVDSPVRDVLESIAADTGNSIELDDEVASGESGSRTVSISLDRASYWEAIDAVLTRAGLDIDCRDGGRRVVVVPTSGRPRGRGCSGSFLVVAEGMEVGRASPDGQPVRIGLRIVWEPRRPPLVIRLPMESVRAETPRGEAVMPSAPGAVLEATVLPATRWVPMTLPLFAKQRGPGSLATVRATVRAWYAAGEHEFELPLEPLPGEMRRRVGEADVLIRARRRSDERVAVEGEVLFAAASEPLASHRTWLADREVELVLGDGSRIAAVTHRVLHRSDRGVAIADDFEFGSGRGDAVVRWRLPAAIREAPAEVIVRDIVR